MIKTYINRAIHDKRSKGHSEFFLYHKPYVLRCGCGSLVMKQVIKENLGFKVSSLSKREGMERVGGMSHYLHGISSYEVATKRE